MTSNPCWSRQSIADTSLTLLSIILIRVANALENQEYCRFLVNQKELLETQVAERTKELTLSEQQLTQAMEKAKKLAAQAKQASETKSDFLAKMSHELRTPFESFIHPTFRSNTPLNHAFASTGRK